MNQINQPGEREAEAIHVINRNATILAESAVTQAQCLDAMEQALWLLATAGHTPALAALLKRIDRLRELRNMMELASLNIHVRRLTDARNRLL